MVKHDFRVRPADWFSSTQRAPATGPLIVQMNDEDFPTRFLEDLLTQGVTTTPATSPISSTAIVDPTAQPLYQPVQRLINVALMKISCSTLMYPRVDPTRILSSGMVIRRIGLSTGQMYAWMKTPQGTFSWQPLNEATEHLDPDPTLRPQLSSGDPVADRGLAAMALSAALAESTTPVFVAPPATCTALGSTVLYGMIPTASSEVSDTPPGSPGSIPASSILSSLPSMLHSGQSPNNPPDIPISNQTIDYRWLNDDFLEVAYPPSTGTGTPPLPVANPIVADVQSFTQSLRFLHTTVNAFDGTPAAKAILCVLNRHQVTFDPSQNLPAQGMGDFYLKAKAALLDTNGYATANYTPPTLVMPTGWDWLTNQDQDDLVAAILVKNTANSATVLTPTGRFQDNTRQYQLRMFARLKGETPTCPPELVWSHYSQPFRIAGWFESGSRAHPPVPLPDPTADYMQNAKPNCSFQVPGNLMAAMQGTTLSGLMKGAGGGGGLSLGWICGFNIPLITICAFFVLSIFLSLLNIIFFWLPFIKICIPFPEPSED
jgi:hypothetical protein